MQALLQAEDRPLCPSRESLFASICQDLQGKGFSINPMALPFDMAGSLKDYALSLQSNDFDPAGIGRADAHTMNAFVRSDEIFWLEGRNPTESSWLNWANLLKDYLNRHLYLGLFSFESHIASYRPGQFYKRHLDAFRGNTNRVLSLVVYLNPNWQLEDGGELVLYRDRSDKIGTKITPGFGTVVAFLSEEFPHEVLPASRDRLSIAGWYSVNRCMGNRLDIPA